MPRPEPRNDTEFSTIGEAELVRRALARDGEVFRAIMQRHNRRLYRVARSVVHDDSEAEDVVQEAYVLAFSNLAKFRAEASLATWLTRITLNEALGRLRRRPTVDLSILDSPQGRGAQVIPFPTMPSTEDPERVAAQHEIRGLIEQAIDELPELFRVVFVMRAVEDMSIEETADFLNLRPETVKTRLHRARKLLQQALDEKLAPALTDVFPFAGNRCLHMTDEVLRRLGFLPPAAGEPPRATSIRLCGRPPAGHLSHVPQVRKPRCGKPANAKAGAGRQ
jgi:RNA polymerase sigma-70 factor (ECF subfamily)